MLAHARYEDGSPMTAQDLRDELITLLLDGPTSTSLAWVFERLLRHPDKLARLREEVRRARGRLYGRGGEGDPAPVPAGADRRAPAARADARSAATRSRRGAMVAPCIHLIHRREDIYPNPGSFLPERFLERPAGTYTWIPFGGGVRRCLAASFALLEMKRVVESGARRGGDAPGAVALRAGHKELDLLQPRPHGGSCSSPAAEGVRAMRRGVSRDASARQTAAAA